MKEFFISDCSQQENKIITSSFVVASKQVKAKKNGEPYLALILADRTGQIEAKMWDNVDEFIAIFDQDDLDVYKRQVSIPARPRAERGTPLPPGHSLFVAAVFLQSPGSG